MVEFKETNPVDLLLEHCNRPMRDAQLSAAPAFPVRAFDAMLVGCCGVRQGAHPLRRRLGPRIFRAVEEFATPRIAPRASALLRAAVEDFVRRIWQDAVLLPINRGSICVHAADVDAAIEMSGADRLVGRRRMSGCSCAACLDMGADGLRPALESEKRPRSNESYRVDAPPMSRPSLSWCEAAPIEGPTPQGAIHRALRSLALQSGAPISAPGALDAVASAMVGFCDTVLMRARGGDSQLLRDIAASDRRVDCLREVCAARYDALREDGLMPAAEESDPTFIVTYDGREKNIVKESLESDSDLDHSASNDARALENDETSDDEASECAEVYDGLTGDAVGDALAYLRVPVYAADGDDSDDDVASTARSEPAPRRAYRSMCMVTFDSICPDCGRLCLVTCLKLAHDGETGSVMPRSIASRAELNTIQSLPGYASAALDMSTDWEVPEKFFPVRNRAVLEADLRDLHENKFFRGGLKLSSRDPIPLLAENELEPYVKQAMHEAGVRVVARDLECAKYYEMWTKEIVELAQAARDATEAAALQVWPHQGRFCSVNRVAPKYERALPPIRYVQRLCGNQPVSWDVGAKLQNSLARSNRRRFG